MLATETRTAATGHRRTEALVGVLAGMGHYGTLAELAHDARNMVSALVLYCDLLSDPGVLTPEFVHYASELRVIAAASRSLVEKMALLDRAQSGGGMKQVDRSGTSQEPPVTPRQNWPASVRLLEDPIENLQQELLANRNMLDAIAGLAIAVNMRAEGGAFPVRLSSEDLTRVLVNLVKNASEAIHGVGAIEITLREQPGGEGQNRTLVLSVEDSGTGIAGEMLEKIFDPGWTTHMRGARRPEDGGWPITHRGLGLSITRSIVEAAGGCIHAANRGCGGAKFEIELPVRTR